jgi:TonB family protein
VKAYPNYLGEEATVAQDLRGNNPSQARRLIALTRDESLTAALQELGGSVDFRIVTDTEALSDELLQTTSAIALIDAAAIHSPIEGFVDALATQFPDLRLLVAGHSTEQTALTSRIASQRVFRFVHKPASAQRLKLFIDAASRTAEPHRISATQTFEAMREPSPSIAKIETAIRDSSPPHVAIIGVGVIAAIALGAWVFWPAQGAGNAVTQNVAVVTNPQVADFIRKGDQAFAAGRYAATDGTSAAEFYRDALKLDAKNPQADSGYTRSIDLAARRTEEALTAGKLDEAAAAAETLRLLSPSNSRLAFIQSQIAKERERAYADSSQRQAYEARQSQIRASLGLMSDRLRRGSLLEPARDSAVSNFRDAEAVAPGDTAVRSARDTLVAALLNGADAEINARRMTTARRLVDSASAINSGAPGLDVVRRRIDEATSQAAVPVPAPVTVAPPPEVTTPTIVSAATLKRLSGPEAEYPQRALEQLLSGWVDLEFTVKPDGSTSNITIVGAEPRNTFNNAATNAVRRWRYLPVTSNGVAVEQRVRFRMRFTAVESGKSR